MGTKEEEQTFTMHGSVFRDKPATVKATGVLHRILPISAQRAFRDGAFRGVADGGVVITAGISAVFHPRLAARFVALSRRREDHKYGQHPRQVLEVVQPAGGVGDSRKRVGEKPKLIVFIHGGAWGSGATWMYRLVVDRLTSSDDPNLGPCTVASLGYRVHPDSDTAGQVEDVTEAMRWISGNIGTLGFDSEPEVYIVGHSSGAHIALLYLIQQAEKEAGAASDADRGSESATVSTAGGDRDWDVDGDGGGGRQLKVEGFVGLGGVYDVHRHYQYESWRGVHEISPMKPSNGGVLHTLFDYSHTHLLGRHPHRSRHSRPHMPLTPSPQLFNQQQQQHHEPDRNAIEEEGTSSTTYSERGASPGSIHKNDGSSNRACLAGGAGSFSGRSSRGGRGEAPAAAATEGYRSRRAVGQRLPRTLLVHGTADATVPFSQTAAAATALRSLGVPTAVRFVRGGDHFGTVGQLMFSKNSVVEAAISRFTSQQAKDEACQARADGTALRPNEPQSKL
ncbi:unnamed protein product [Scytosiphon promiscuus]